MCDSVEIVIIKFENHPSILAIKYNVSIEEALDFSCAKKNDILKDIDNLDSQKTGTFRNIPTNLPKEMSEICAPLYLKQ